MWILFCMIVLPFFLFHIWDFMHYVKRLQISNAALKSHNEDLKSHIEKFRDLYTEVAKTRDEYRDLAYEKSAQLYQLERERRGEKIYYS